MPLAWLSPYFQSVPSLPICDQPPSSCCPGAEPRVDGFVYILGPCGSFKQSLLRDQQFILPPQLPNSHWFLQPEVMSLYYPSPGTLGCAVWPGVGLTHSQGMFPDFYPSHVDGGPPLPIPPLLPPPLCTTHLLSSPPLLPVWMNVASLNPWLWNFIQSDSLTLLGAICFEIQL